MPSPSLQYHYYLHRYYEKVRLLITHHTILRFYTLDLYYLKKNFRIL